MIYSLLLLTGLGLAGTAQDRCATRDCLCRVYVPPSSYQVDSSQLVIEYKEGVSELSSIQISQIQLWKKGKSTIQIFGSADGCGTAAQNKVIVDARLGEVQKYVENGTPFNLGETSTTHNHHNRRVVLSTLTTPLQAAILSRPADVYLIDASSSMSVHWAALQTLPFPPTSTVYVAKVNDCFNGQNIHKVKTGGPTEIWYPYWRVLQNTPAGSTIAFISDFKSTVPLLLQEKEYLSRLSRDKDIQVMFIQY